MDLGLVGDLLPQPPSAGQIKSGCPGEDCGSPTPGEGLKRLVLIEPRVSRISVGVGQRPADHSLWATPGHYLFL